MKHVALLLGTKKKMHTKNTYTYKCATGNRLIKMYHILIKTNFLPLICLRKCEIPRSSLPKPVPSSLSPRCVSLLPLGAQK